MTSPAALPIIAVLIPVLGRPHRVAPLMASLAASTDRAKAYFIVNDDDAEEIAALIAAGVTYVVVPSSRRSWAMKINDGVKHTTEPWLLLGADDLHFHPGWVEEAEKLFESPDVGVIGTNDLGHHGTMNGTHSTHPLAARTYIESLGTEDGPGVCHEGYHHNYPDTEIVATAMRRGRYQHAPGVFVEHLHPAWGKAATDDTYRLGQSRVAEDAALFHAREVQFGWARPQDKHAAERLQEQIAAGLVTVPQTARQARLARERISGIVPVDPADWTIDPKDIPILVIVRDRLTPLRTLLRQLKDAEMRRVILIDNGSTYPPLIEFLNSIRSQYEIVNHPQNDGPESPWSSGIVAKVVAEGAPFYAITDGDVVLDDKCPADFMAALLDGLQKCPWAFKSALALRVDNIPDRYELAEGVRVWERQFWLSVVGVGQKGAPLYAAATDTTLALFHSHSAKRRGYDLPGVRVGAPYLLNHAPWYEDTQAPTEEAAYYRDHASAASTWSRGTRVNLGCGHKVLPGYVNVDVYARPGVLKADLMEPWPWEESSVNEILAHHVIEHLPDRIFTMNEAYRVLCPDGVLSIEVPTTDGPGAFQDPTHCSFWHRRSFMYYEDGNAYRTAMADSYGIRARFRVLAESIMQTVDGPILSIRLAAVKV